MPTFDSRVYADLIYKAESKFANWDPAYPIKAGDYGSIDRKTGIFQKSGNIYEDEVVEDIEEKFGLVQESVEDYKVVHTGSAKERGFNLGAGATLGNFAGAYLNLQFDFSNSRGALLIMHQPRITRVPDQFLKIAANLICLKKKILVVSAVTCPGYVRYLSTRRSETLGVALMANIPVATVPGLSAGGTLGLKWKINAVSGNLQQSYHEKELYTPLFYAKEIRKSWLNTRRRDELEPDMEYTIDDCWTNAELPWDPIDEEGKEISHQYEMYNDSETESDSESD